MKGLFDRWNHESFEYLRGSVGAPTVSECRWRFFDITDWSICTYFRRFCLGKCCSPQASFSLARFLSTNRWSIFISYLRGNLVLNHTDIVCKIFVTGAVIQQNYYDFLLRKFEKKPKFLFIRAALFKLNQAETSTLYQLKLLIFW